MATKIITSENHNKRCNKHEKSKIDIYQLSPS